MLVRARTARTTIGMSADDSAPAATSWKIRSGIRNAAKNASSSRERPERCGDDDDPDVAEDARDEERARDDEPGAGERWPGRRSRGGVATRPRVGLPIGGLEATRARRACRSGSSRGSRGRAAPGRRAGPRRRRAGASRTSGGACAARRRPAGRRGDAAGRGGSAGRGRRAARRGGSGRSRPAAGSMRRPPRSSRIGRPSSR